TNTGSSYLNPINFSLYPNTDLIQAKLQSSLSSAIKIQVDHRFLTNIQQNTFSNNLTERATSGSVIFFTKHFNSYSLRYSVSNLKYELNSLESYFSQSHYTTKSISIDQNNQFKLSGKMLFVYTALDYGITQIDECSNFKQ